MDSFTICPADVWTRNYDTASTRPYATWIEGSYSKSIQENQTGSSSVSTTDAGGRTTAYSDGLASSHLTTTSRDGTGISEAYRSTEAYSASLVWNYIPTSDDVTFDTSNRSETKDLRQYLNGDTVRETLLTYSTALTYGTDEDSDETITPVTETLTAMSDETAIAGSVGTVGQSTMTTAETTPGGWSLEITSTQSISLTGSITSTWETVLSESVFATSQTTYENATQDITYAGDYRSYNTDSQVEVTNHALSPLRNTVCLMNGGRDADDSNLGNKLWMFSLGTMATAATTEGRFTDLFSSVDSATATIEDYQKFKTSMLPCTAITVSINTVATTTWTVTSTNGATGSVDVTVSTTSKNGVAWDSYDRFKVGTVHSISAAASNTSTATITFDLGDVSTSLHTYTVGTAIVSETHFFGTYQETGYDSSGFTSTTLTNSEAASSSSETRLALYSPATTTQTVAARSTLEEETLISIYSSVGTAWNFVGLGKTTTTRVFSAEVSTTLQTWLSELNYEINRYTTNSTSSYNPNGLNSTSYAIGETRSETRRTEERILPNTWAQPYQSESLFFGGLNNAWHRAPAIGFAGPGGNFTQSSMPVYLTISIGLVGGGAFGTQTLRTDHLPTALAYDGVTVFPARTDFPTQPLALPEGAINIKYLSRINSVGTGASVAVTWTTTSLSGTVTVKQTTAATYLVEGQTPITADFFKEKALTFDAPGLPGIASCSGGYGIGNNALGNPYTVRLDGGFAAWTAFSAGSSISSATSSSTGASLSLSFAGNIAIAISTEPIISMSWGSNRNDHFASSTPYLPT